MSELNTSAVVITDTSCFIILEKIHALEFLNKIFDIVLTTPEIAFEYGHPLPSWVTIQRVGNTKLQQQFNHLLDPGEASAIALAHETPCQYLITDDRAARKFAESLGLQVKGSVGVLIYAKQKGIIKAIKPYIQQIEKTNFRISTVLISRILEAAGE
ncbi:putative nucleic acid-binding protein [Mucilaginibacter gracilis]|uniref:Putative nucleic acid-binding protein n=1 Tax=Mucilaginibacter gracilis TaxID=423350 RepID=A0A495J1A4_9SPHI|nr:DUF3368 domain-containing protein [Mucilaginibacter gracilis]RKR82750.1 putative nucleic acid-binding protein [Mucilaginibacter gracilis]